MIDDELLDVPGVVGIAGGSTTIFVESEDIIESVPRTMDSETVDIKVVGKVKALQRKYRPLKGGISISPDALHVGTLGICLEDGSCLTNAHVSSMDSDRVDYYPLGNEIFQPALVDGGVKPGDLIGHTTKFTRLLPGEWNYADAAIVSPVVGFSPMEVADIGTVDGMAEPSEGMSVRKRGRTSGITEGKITHTNASMTADYGEFGHIKFRGVTVIEPPILEGGDSGSAIICDHNRIVALGFAGSDVVSLGIPIDTTLSEVYRPGSELAVKPTNFSDFLVCATPLLLLLAGVLYE